MDEIKPRWRSGEDNATCKIKDEQIAMMRKEWAEGKSQKEIAAAFGVSRLYAGKLIRGQSRPSKAYYGKLPEGNTVEIPGWSHYRISDQGRLFSCQTTGGVFLDRWRMVEGSVNRDGYLQAKLSSRVRKKLVRIHTLVLLAFVGPRPNGMVACHWNGNPVDNRVENLRWATPAENIADQARHGTTARGERHGCAKIAWKDACQMRDMRKTGATFSEIAVAFGMSISQVQRTVKGQSWRLPR